jgi:hypothetical protein
MESESPTASIPESDPGKSFVITRRNGDQYTVWVSVCDYERVIAAGPWCLVPATSACRSAYAFRNVTLQCGRRTTQKLHHFVLGVAAVIVDHENTNGLDNRRSNLRLATRGQNSSNAACRRVSASGVKGAQLHRRKCGDRWTVKIKCDGKVFYLGSFSSLEDAAMAFEGASLLLHGSFSRVR